MKRPEPLFNLRGAFAVYVVSDSMSPAYEHGDMLLVHPAKPMRRQDDSLFVCRAGHMAAGNARR